MTLVERLARRLPGPPPVLELDVTDPGQLESLAGRVREHAGGLDGVVHAIANAPQAPLGWDITDHAPAARACVALLSDWFPATTGEIVHVDGGVHAVGA